MVGLGRYIRIPQEFRPSEIFKQDSFSPSKIALQIVLLQTFYYLTATILFYLWGTLGGYELNIISWLFSWEFVEFSNSFGILISLIWLIDSLICVLFLTVIVGRSKLAWDFAITIHAINFIIVIVYTGMLPSLEWLVLQVFSSLILIFLGTWTTRWKELRDTFFDGLVDSQPPQNNKVLESFGDVRMKDLEAQK